MRGLWFGVNGVVVLALYLKWGQGLVGVKQLPDFSERH